MSKFGLKVKDLAATSLAEEFAGKLGIFDVPCPTCGPGKRSHRKRVRPVLGVWHEEPGFIRYYCIRCEDKGVIVLNEGAHIPSRAVSNPPLPVQRRIDQKQQTEKAQYLWNCSQPVRSGSVVETYLRSRHYSGPIPATLRYLPPRRPDQHPTMIAAFGIAEEPEPGLLSISSTEVKAVHLTFLRPDGSGKAGTGRDKKMIGPVSGNPICLAPCNDLLSLTICEGIEDALSFAEMTGVGLWAAGSATHMSKLAAAVPDWVDHITINADADEVGQAAAAALKTGLEIRGLSVRVGTLREVLR